MPSIVICDYDGDHGTLYLGKLCPPWSAADMSVTRKLDWLDWTAPAVVALLVAGMNWVWGRTVNGGKIFSPFQRRLLLFAVLFTLGTGYLIVIATLFRWSDQVMFVLIGAWGGVLASVALLWHRRARESPR